MGNLDDWLKVAALVVGGATTIATASWWLGTKLSQQTAAVKLSSTEQAAATNRLSDKLERVVVDVQGLKTVVETEAVYRQGADEELHKRIDTLFTPRPPGPPTQ